MYGNGISTYIWPLHEWMVDDSGKVWYTIHPMGLRTSSCGIWSRNRVWHVYADTWMQWHPWTSGRRGTTPDFESPRSGRELVGSVELLFFGEAKHCEMTWKTGYMNNHEYTWYIFPRFFFLRFKYLRKSICATYIPKDPCMVYLPTFM